jgi:hypothetical protein
LPAIAVRRIYCELELKLRIKLRRRLKRDKPDELSVPEYGLADGFRVPRTFCSWPIVWPMAVNSGC